MRLLYRRYLVGIKRHFWTLIWKSFQAGCVPWGIIEPIAFFSKPLEDMLKGNIYTYIALTFTVAVVTFLVNAPSQINIQIRHGLLNTKITVKFGDILHQNGHVVLAANENFDYEIGDKVAKSSLHGQFIERVAGSAQRAREFLHQALKNVSPLEKIQRKDGDAFRYDLGTTAIIPIGHMNYFLFALTKTDPQTFKASADVMQLWQCLEKVWPSVRNFANNQTVYLPLLGAGCSGIDIGKVNLLWLLILSILINSKKQHITNEFVIVLSVADIEEIDLDLLARRWN